MGESETKSKGSAAKKGCLIVVGVFVALAVLGSIVGSDKDASSASTAESTGESVEATAAPAEVAAVAVTAKELAAAYENNEAAAQQQYGKKVLQVTGKISAIQLDFSDKPYLVLVGTNQFMGPQAHLDEESHSRAASLSKGQKVSLTCQDVSEAVGTAMLKDCRIN